MRDEAASSEGFHFQKYPAATVSSAQTCTGKSSLAARAVDEKRASVVERRYCEVCYSLLILLVMGH